MACYLELWSCAYDLCDCNFNNHFCATLELRVINNAHNEKLRMTLKNAVLQLLKLVAVIIELLLYCGKLFFISWNKNLKILTIGVLTII